MSIWIHLRSPKVFHIFGFLYLHSELKWDELFQMHGEGWDKSCESQPCWAFAIPNNCCWSVRYPGPFRIQPYISCQGDLHQPNREFEGKSSKPIPEGCIRFCHRCYFIACKKVQAHQNKAVIFIFVLMHSFVIQQHITTVIHANFLTSRSELFTFHAIDE